jgi:excisionase family DNA binding protein
MSTASVLNLPSVPDSQDDALRLVTVPQFADHINVHARSVYLWCREGKLRSVRVGGRRLIPLTELRRACEKGI